MNFIQSKALTNQASKTKKFNQNS